MAELMLPISLQDGSIVQVNDCEFDLLLHILYKHDFDKKRVDQELEWICENNSDPNVKTLLLKQALRQFSSELSNKILAKSISESVNHRKIVEDMIVDVNRMSYTLADDVSDIRKILHLRKKIFVNEEGYPSTAVTNGFEKESLHVMATIRNSLVGCVSIVFDGPKGLPMDRYLDLSKYKKGKNIEVDKLAVVGDKRMQELSFHLMWLCYSVTRFWGADRMFVFTLSKKAENINIYTRFGFQKTGTFNVFDREEATALMLDFDEKDTYEKQLKTTELLRLGKKLLNKFTLKRIS